MKNSGISLDHYYSTNCGEEVFRRVYSEYHEYLYAHHLIDFEDMLFVYMGAFQGAEGYSGCLAEKNIPTF